MRIDFRKLNQICWNCSISLLRLLKSAFKATKSWTKQRLTPILLYVLLSFCLMNLGDAPFIPSDSKKLHTPKLFVINFTISLMESEKMQKLKEEEREKISRFIQLKRVCYNIAIYEARIRLRVPIRYDTGMRIREML